MKIIKTFAIVLSLVFMSTPLISRAAALPITQEEIEAILEKNHVTNLSSSTLPKELRREPAAASENGTKKEKQGIAVASTTLPAEPMQAIEFAVEKLRLKLRNEYYKAKDSWLMDRSKEIASSLDEITATGGKQAGEVGGWFRAKAESESKFVSQATTGLDQLKNQNAFTVFFVGPNSTMLNNTKSALNSAKTELSSLSELKKKLPTKPEQDNVSTQITKTEGELIKLSDELKNQEARFGLWSWLKNLFIPKQLKGQTL